jgi:thiamine-phosphate pyrophosphorylase
MACLPPGLYGILDLPSKRVTPDGTPAAPRALYEPLVRAGVGVLQLRMKTGSAAAMLAVLDELRVRFPVEGPGPRLIVNDRLDVALAGRAHGAHLGQDDLPIELARPLCPPGFLLGISTHSEEQAAAAIAAGADYIGFGPIFPTGTKDNPDPVVGTERLAAVCRASPIPVVAIGGITLARVPEVVAAGAHAAAVIAAVNHAPDIYEAARTVQELFGIR